MKAYLDSVKPVAELPQPPMNKQNSSFSDKNGNS